MHCVPSQSTLGSPCRAVGAPRISAFSANNPLSPLRSELDSFFNVESANHPESREEFPIEATGVCDPDARIRHVSLSLLSMEMELPSTTRSESLPLKRSIASPTESEGSAKGRHSRREESGRTT